MGCRVYVSGQRTGVTLTPPVMLSCVGVRRASQQPASHPASQVQVLGDEATTIPTTTATFNITDKTKASNF